MKNLNTALLTVAISASLVACGGSGGTPENQGGSSQSLSRSSINTVGLANDEVSLVDGQSLLLQGSVQNDSKNDLSISNVAYEVNESTIAYRFTVKDSGGAEIPLESLSVALEVAATGSFADSYSVPLFDIREQGENIASDTYELSARSTSTDLPAGDYIARLVVNPNWQNAFDIVPAGSDAVPYNYLAERDFSNNASGSFQITVGGNYVCNEDEFENSDSVASATAIPIGGQVSASLCFDDADYYSVALSLGEITSLTFDYTDAQNNPNPATRYVVLDSNFNRVTEPTVARESNRIVISAVDAGKYYLVLFGDRSSYRITRIGGGIADDFANENLFLEDTIVGPRSWLLGDVVLNRLALSEAILTEQTVNCGRITTQYGEDRPIAYVTPLHFADIHEFRFLADGSYLIDGEEVQGWHVSDGDVSSAEWYDNGFPGYAQRVSSNEWRYWSDDGFAYVECTLEINR